MNTSNLNLYVVDDDEAVRRGVGNMLLSRGHAVQAFDSGDAFLASAKLQDCGCVLLDLRMAANRSGLQVFDELRASDSPLVVLFLSGHGDIPMAVDAVKSGAFDWLEKPCDDLHLLDKVDAALHRAAQVCALREAGRKVRLLWNKLTPREREVARLVALGKPNKVVARELEPPCGPRAVETHRAHIFQKLEVANSNELDRFIRDHVV